MSKQLKQSIQFIGTMATSFEQRLLGGVARYARMRQPRWQLRWVGAGDAHLTDTIDGLVVFALSPQNWTRMRSMNVPMVATSSRHIGQGVPTVVTDDEAIGAVAGRFFRDKFYRSFAYFGPDDIPFGPLRGKGFTRSLYPDVVRMIQLTGRESAAEREAALCSSIRNLPPATAIFAANDVFARAILEVAEKVGRAIPSDLSVLGADADELIGLSCPIDLSSVDSRPGEIGYQAAALLDRMISDPAPVPEDTVIRIPPGGVVQGSSTDSLATDDEFILKANALLKAHACEQDFSLDQLCVLVGCSRRSLEMRFARFADTGMAGLLWKYRLDRARELLLTTTLNLAEIAERSGFRNPYHFSDKFRKVTGQTPGQFRREGGR